MARPSKEAREAQRQAAADWRDAAVADGWTVKPTYVGGEPMEQSATLEREGYKAMVLSRPAGFAGFDCAEGSVHVWCPTGISVTVPWPYSWIAIVAGTRHCPECGANDVDTFRVAFANRACSKCVPAMRTRLERPGWTS